SPTEDEAVGGGAAVQVLDVAEAAGQARTQGAGVGAVDGEGPADAIGQRDGVDAAATAAGDEPADAAALKAEVIGIGAADKVRLRESERAARRLKGPGVGAGDVPDVGGVRAGERDVDEVLDTGEVAADAAGREVAQVHNGPAVAGVIERVAAG